MSLKVKVPDLLKAIAGINAKVELSELSRLSTSDLVRLQLQLYHKTLVLGSMRIMIGALLVILLGTELPMVLVDYKDDVLLKYSTELFFLLLFFGIIFESIRFKALVRSKAIDFILGFRKDRTGHKKPKKG
jgi:hypothetical protein